MRRLMLVLTAPLLLAACKSAPTPAGGSTAATAPICPITGKPVTGDGAVAYYGMYEVVCADRASANQFASMPVKKRAKLAGPQVLAAQGITNDTCPLTGKPLDGDAVTVKYDGAVYGFASLADANQFMSLPKKKQAATIAAFNAAAAKARAAQPGAAEDTTPAPAVPG